ncbi:unnamed protein product [Paramecium primaurelia]|uniref:Cyclic nucleotide-binding domain-containing protein n=1 Tax=Paramecium primaurelia TaxID=5886 RepID=A0A8S1P929_PARPR|nr:unnamed protein product [Paramecium primaurelia]
MITVGYGDISPQTTTERFCGIFFLLVACGVLSFTMNSIGNTMQQMSQKKDQQKKNIAEINNYMQKVKIPKHLQQRVRKIFIIYMGFKQTYQIRCYNYQFILRIEIVTNCSSTYTNFCKTFYCVLLLDITQILFEQTAQRDEYIIIEDNRKNSHHLDFIQDGLINIVLPKTRQVVAKLPNKQIFGEINFFGNVGRTASVKSEGFSILFILKRDDFLQILQKYPKDFEKFNLIQEEVNKNQFQVLQIHYFACELPGHVVRDCPQLHFIVDLYVYNKTKNRCIKQIMKEYIRKDRINFNAIKHQYFIKKEALSIQTEIPMIRFIIEERNLENAQFNTIQFKNEQSDSQTIKQKLDEIILEYQNLFIQIKATVIIKFNLLILIFQYSNIYLQIKNIFNIKLLQTYSQIDLFEFGFDFEIYNTDNNLNVFLIEVQKYYNGTQIKPKIDTEYDVNVFEEYLNYYAINMEDINRFKLEVKPERLKQFLPYTTLVENKQSRQII